MTTCNPRWASYERLIVFGKMVDKYPKTIGAPAAISNLV
jgi:sortase (surface protein transpeptidase)